ncbi:16S rRNA (cytosine(1402)-N(4))-methyltransferase [candidate division Kazan bacterium]|uniref:Ribosomal RNA small subunit methyltransferase H n=1 Tax=candidate division Kazan bacterium TaxID=2202143 RepID=A0A420ZCE0_UNCK3|nr:MAG: 16S rRNA (cytosine(1402)-N(4))-methyltransferase [candidate division Kazan bacterium]
MTIPKHIPVLTDEVIRLLDPKTGDTFVDATLGLGGHAAAILEHIGPHGKLIGIDQDEQALQIARTNLRPYQNQLALVFGNFRNIGQLVKGTGTRLVDGILFDLGLSSYQLDARARGFSFNKQANLDMRMDTKGSLTAEIVVNSYPREKLAEIFREYGEEPKAHIFARKIVEARKKRRIVTTQDLVEVIGGPQAAKQPWRAGRRGRIHPATRVFQALRIEVNDELNAIREALPQAVELLRPASGRNGHPALRGGRLAVISFHSLEDRIVKRFFQDLKTGGSVNILTKKAVTPSWSEASRNRRARSAKLRVIEKI